LRLIDRIFLEIRTQLNKQLLILIDDTDKIPTEKGLSLFFDNGHHLAAPKVCILYVIDVAIATSPKFTAIRAKFGDESFFPAIKVRDRNNKIDTTSKQNRAILVDLIHVRIPEQLIDDKAMKLAIEFCGGVVRELIRLLRMAIFHARGGKVMSHHIEYVSHEIANEYNFYGRHTKILKAVIANPDWLAGQSDNEADEVFLELLHMPALFQYRNGERKWYRPYPIFIDWLKNLE
jgi:hypothetical protein